MTEPIKVGFIGAGSRANSLFQNLVMNKNNEDKILPIAVFDIDSKLCENWKMLVDSTHTKYDDILNQDLDAVIIGTPPATHANFAIQALKRGIDVWSEVPMGLTINELWGIIDATKSNKGNKGKYSYGENYCYMLQPQFVANKNKQGKLGKIYYSEGEYTHSVEHYMIQENFLYNKELDPELHPETKPTWRADFPPSKYGHALGPCLYALNRNPQNIIERPTEVTAMGNMKMQKRFNTDNFTVTMIKTDQDTIIKFVLGFVLGHHGRIFYSYWGSQGLFMGGSFQTDKHYYYEVPAEHAHFPDRHQQTPQILSDEDLKNLGTPHADGGHGGGDNVMFQWWVDDVFNKRSTRDIDVYRAAEMTAPGILALDSMKEKKSIPIPRFE